MNEQEMREEIERLRRECDDLRSTCRHYLSKGRIPLSDQEIAEMERDSITLTGLHQPSDQTGPAKGNLEAPAADDRAMLPGELSRARQERKWLHRIVCRMLPVDDPETVEQELLEMMNQPWYAIDDIIGDLLQDQSEALPPQNQIPA